MTSDVATVDGSRAPVSPQGWPDDQYLTRDQAAELLGSLGLAVTARTLLSWYSTREDGPPVYHLNGRVRYRAGDLRQWLRSRLSTPTRSRAELTT